MVTEAIRWRIPRGSQGFMGWQLTSSGAQVIPVTPGAFIIASGESGLWPIVGLHTSGDWHVTGYNTGAYPHAINLEFLVSPVSPPPASLGDPAAIAGLAMANLIDPYTE